MANYEKMWQDLGLDVELHNQLLKSLDRTFQNTVGSQKNRPWGMKYFDNVLHESHSARVAELLFVKAKGNKVIGTFCIYVPDEIALAVDITPIALCGGTNFSIPYAEKLFPRDICPLVKSTLGLAFSKTCPYAPVKNMAVGETTCDAKKKTWEILASKVNFHVMEVPQKKEEPDSKLWQKEIKAFKDKVEALAGKKVESKRLKETIKIMNDKRRALQKLNEFRKFDPPPISGLDALVIMQVALIDEPVRFTEKLNQLNTELEERINKGVSPFSKGTKRIMFSGCPAVIGNWKVHSLIEKSGAVIVIDESCTGTRYFENLVDEQPTDLEGQLLAIADRYLKINCACFTPNQERIDGLVQKTKDYNVNGVIQYILQYCHGYNVEAIKVEGALKSANVPSLKIETDYSEEDIGPLRTRIEAFIERLA
uniref:2-hydroxyacyl-CoA dehydratase n=1 Tax=candidate division WOR-3 bacterium TaxID=2052148 RepID=A0A7C6A968_UNCW3